MITRREVLAAACAGVALSCRPNAAISGGTSNDTDTLDQMFSVGGPLTIPQGIYLVDYLRPRSNSIITIEPGTQFIRTASPYSLLELKNISDVYITANGATFDASVGAAQTSHSVKFLGTLRCSLSDAKITGSAPTKDGVYFGLGDAECYDSHIIGGSISNTLRNGMSFISAIRCSIQDASVFGNNGSPGSGIHVEANNHEQLNIENTIKNNDVFGNQKNGIMISFGDRTVINGNHCHGNGLRGIYATSGGNTRKVGVRRKQYDAMGILGFDSSTGFIQLSGDLSLVQPNTWIYLKVKNGGILPANLRQQRYQVSEVGDGIRIGKSSFTSEAIGSFNPDPDLSDFFIETIGKHGQSFGTRIINNHCHDNGKEGVLGAQSGGMEIIGNNSHDNAGFDVHTKYCEGVEVN